MTAPVEGVRARDLEGKRVGDYVLETYLGEGAFGAVFRSSQCALGKPLRRVALKLSHRTGLTAAAALNLLDDAFLLADAMDRITDAAARLHLVQVYDAGLIGAGGRAFLAMEYVEGGTLADRFARQRKIDAEQLTAWTKQVATALGALHRLDPPVVHRDLKPDNVLLGLDNRVRLVDFGLAARVQELGYAQGVAGTATYMAPETSEGFSNPASDVYSLGLLMYEGLTGQHPFRDLVPPVDVPDHLHTQWVAEAKRRHPAVRPSVLSNTVTPKLDRIVLRCLEFEPGGRFRDAADLLEALSREDPVPDEVDVELARPADSKSTRRLHKVRDKLEGELAAAATRDARFELLRRLGEVLGKLDLHADAARRLREAWELTEQSALLHDTRDRIRLLSRLADAYRRSGNEFQARRYETLRGRERGGGR
ncbi:serine/threonine-protein kinase [Amycolatopsis sp. lyj-23]|uniref:serine/threonine-protein kinase n=1 Tax=Amycolatopsis sp. lyj-23 TaxID=2789283 RepID=UPI003978ECA9